MSIFIAKAHRLDIICVRARVSSLWSSPHHWILFHVQNFINNISFPCFSASSHYSMAGYSDLCEKNCSLFISLSFGRKSKFSPIFFHFLFNHENFSFEKCSQQFLNKKQIEWWDKNTQKKWKWMELFWTFWQKWLKTMRWNVLFADGKKAQFKSIRFSCLFFFFQ